MMIIKTVYTITVRLPYDYRTPAHPNNNDNNDNNDNNEEKEIPTIVGTKKSEEDRLDEIERKKIEQKKKSDAAKAATRKG